MNLVKAVPVPSVGGIAPVFLSDRTDRVCPANTAENILWSGIIPGGSLGPNGMLRITTFWQMNTTANIKNMRVKFGSVTYQNVGYASLNTCHNQVMIYNRNSAGAQMGTASALANPFSASGSAQVFGTDNTANDQSITITGQLNNAADTLVLRAVTVELLR